MHKLYRVISEEGNFLWGGGTKREAMLVEKNLRMLISEKRPQLRSFDDGI